MCDFQSRRMETDSSSLWIYTKEVLFGSQIKEKDIKRLLTIRDKKVLVDSHRK